MDNQQSYWYTGQIVTATQMTNFTQDLYSRFGDITQTQAPCILNIGAIVQTGGNVAVAAGSFRFADAHYSFLPYDAPIFGNAPAASAIAVTGDGYIVARYTVTPNTTNQTNYTFPTTYMFVTSVDTTTDCIVAVITSGLVSGYGTFFNNNPDIFDDTFNNIVNITATNGLNITPGGLNVDTTAAGVNTTLSNTTINSEWQLISKEVATNNYARFLTYVNTTTHQSEVALTGATSGSETYRLAVYNNARPIITGISTPATSTDIVIANDFNTSALTNGYVYIPGGIILQWGTASFGNGVTSASFSYPITFPNALLNAQAIVVSIGGLNTISQVTNSGTAGGTVTFSATTISSGQFMFFLIGH